MTTADGARPSRRARWIAAGTGAIACLVVVAGLIVWLANHDGDAAEESVMSVTCDQPETSDNIAASWDRGGAPQYFRDELFLEVSAPSNVGGDTFVTVTWAQKSLEQGSAADGFWLAEEEVVMPLCGEATLGDYGTLTMISYTNPPEVTSDDDGLARGAYATFEVSPSHAAPAPDPTPSPNGTFSLS
ncbi:hypothetical protein [Demequina globuliformis]|uniref:hypothetical protein n=1 Tax=Demequina globuliformis TaxID=676202 RepID=UPI000B1159AE|nr:hypothetical protein [Demequina globuliformis]